MSEAEVPVDINKSHSDVLASIPSGWMLRECQAYHSELKACQSLKGRFYQYYVHGDQTDCSQWYENHKDCKLWTNNADTEAACRIIDREKERIKQRLTGHYQNDVWEKRSSPPTEEEWNKPLPQYLLDRQKNSYLAIYDKKRKINTTETNAASDDPDLKMLEVQSKMINAAPTCTIL